MKLIRMSSSRRWRRGMVGLLVSAVLATTGSLLLMPRAEAAPKAGARKPAKPAVKVRVVPEIDPAPEQLAPPLAPVAPSSAPGESVPASQAEPSPASPASPAPAPAPAAPKPVDDLYEGPDKPKPKPVVPAKPAAPNELAAPRSPGPKYADVYPSEYRVAESDLGLQPAGEARAQAAIEFLRAQRAEESGDADVALEAWKRAAALDPADAKLAVNVATELAKRNEVAEAIRVLKDCIAAAPTEPRALIYLAQVYSKHLNKTELAVQTVQKAVEVAPEYFPAYETLFELVGDSGDKKKAGEVIDRALKSPAKTATFWLRLGDFLVKESLDESGKASPEDQARMEKAYLRAVELKPDDASILTHTGDFFVLARDTKRSLEFYDRAMKLNQAPIDAATKGLRAKYIEALIANDRQAEALPLLEDLARDPSSALEQRLFARLGDLYEQTNQPDKAIELYKRSLVLDVSAPTNHMGLAYTLARAKRYDEAVATVAEAVKKFPDLPTLRWQQAQIFGFAHRYEEALAIFSKTYEQAKDNDETILTADFYANWATIAEQAGNMDLAAEKLKVAIKTNPRSATYLNNLGYMWVDRGVNLEEAEKLIRQALEIEPRSGTFLDSLGWYYFKVGKFEDAKRELLAALDLLKEDDPSILDHLADTYEKLGEHRQAIAYWERALKLRAPDEKFPETVKGKIEAAKKKGKE